MSLAKLIELYTSCTKLPISSLCCIGAKKYYLFSVQKVIMFDLFQCGHDSFLSYWINHIYKVWFPENKVHCSFVSFAWIAHFESDIGHGFNWSETGNWAGESNP